MPQLKRNRASIFTTGLNFDDRDLSNGGADHIGKAVSPRRLLQAGDLLGREIHEQGTETGASNQDIVGSKRKADLIIGFPGFWLSVNTVFIGSFQSEFVDFLSLPRWRLWGWRLIPRGVICQFTGRADASIGAVV